MCVHVAQSYKTIHKFQQITRLPFRFGFDHSKVVGYATAGKTTIVVAATLKDTEGNLQKFITNCGWGTNIGNNLAFNARFETMASKPTWRNSVQDQRILVPVDGFYERGYYIRPEDPDKAFALAGITVMNSHHQAIIATRPAAKAIAAIHTRMPVIVPVDKWNDWLNPEVPFSEFANLINLSFPFGIERSGEHSESKAS